MTVEHVGSASAHVGRNRILGVAGATLAAVAVWAIEVPLLGIRLLTQFGNTAPQGVGIAAVVVSALAGSLAGWGYSLFWRGAMRGPAQSGLASLSPSCWSHSAFRFLLGPRPRQKLG